MLKVWRRCEVGQARVSLFINPPVEYVKCSQVGQQTRKAQVRELCSHRWGRQETDAASKSRPLPPGKLVTALEVQL